MVNHCCTPETDIILYINYTPIKKKSFFIVATWIKATIFSKSD